MLTGNDGLQIIDEVLPLLLEVRLTDPDIIVRVVSKYRLCNPHTAFAKRYTYMHK